MNEIIIHILHLIIEHFILFFTDFKQNSNKAI